MLPNDEQLGHRKRLREKFVKSGLAGFHDYEIVELLLSLGTPRKDCKQQAKEILKRFKTLRGALSASMEELQQIDGIGPHNVFGIKLVQEVAREFLKEKHSILPRPLPLKSMTPTSLAPTTTNPRPGRTSSSSRLEFPASRA